MIERVLITGASGFVGYHLINEALKNKLEVFAAVRKSSNIDHLKELDIQYVFPDFGNVDALVKELEDNQYDYIIHAAGTTKAKTQLSYNKINADYTYNLALAATKAHIPLKKFVFISSLAALGPLPGIDGIISENIPPGPVTAYGISKLLAELKLSKLPTLPLITLRPTAVYGPRDKDILIFLKKISEGIEAYIGTEEQQLSFIYVTDLAKVTLQALLSGVFQKTYNISDGKAYDRYAIADYAKQILHKKTYKFNLPLPLVKVLAGLLEGAYTFSKNTPALNTDKLNELTGVNWICDIRRAKADLGFAPEYDLEKGLTESLKWYKDNGWLKVK